MGRAPSALSNHQPSPAMSTVSSLPILETKAHRTRPVRFALGHVVATSGALAAVRENGVDVLALVCRHASGDWGAVGVDDTRANDHALVHGARVLSAYETAAGRLWVITEADRSATTVLLPSEN